MSLSRYEALVRQLYQVGGVLSLFGTTIQTIRRPYSIPFVQLNLTCQAKLGLENIQRLHAALGEPLKGVPNIIHVGGRIAFLLLGRQLHLYVMLILI